MGIFVYFLLQFKSSFDPSSYRLRFACVGNAIMLRLCIVLNHLANIAVNFFLLLLQVLDDEDYFLLY